jgi:hypothetical protein
MSYRGIYLNDHYAGSTTGVELAKRAAGNNEGEPEFGPPLQRIATEIAEDREELKRLMDRCGVRANPVKAGIALALERAGRLKPNGQLRGYSPLSRLVEVEGLATGVTGKLSLWRALLTIAPGDGRLDEGHLTRLAERAEDQLAQLHELRDAAARIALIS